jgi:molybdopterin synthase catalytic subunit
MKVRVLMFGALAEQTAREDTFEIDEPTVAALLDAVGSRYPDAAAVLSRCAVAVNHEVAGAGRALEAADEVAILPPMSGGAVHVRITPSPGVPSFASAEAGGTTLFIGKVRGSCERGPVDRLEYSAYEAMAEKVLHTIAEEATERFGLTDVGIEHAIGPRRAGEETFVVACAAPHFTEGSDACRYVVAEVKRRAPIWKKEIGPWGERWVGL